MCVCVFMCVHVYAILWVCVYFIYSSPLFALITTASSSTTLRFMGLSYTYDKLLLSNIIVMLPWISSHPLLRGLCNWCKIWKNRTNSKEKRKQWKVARDFSGFWIVLFFGENCNDCHNCQLFTICPPEIINNFCITHQGFFHNFPFAWQFWHYLHHRPIECRKLTENSLDFTI